MDFLRHLRPEYSNEKRAAKSNALGPSQSVELSLHRLLPSRAGVRFAQLNKNNFLTLTQFIEQTHEISKTIPHYFCFCYCIVRTMLAYFR